MVYYTPVSITSLKCAKETGTIINVGKEQHILALLSYSTRQACEIVRESTDIMTASTIK